MGIFLTSRLKEQVQQNCRQEEVELWSIAAEISAQTRGINRHAIPLGGFST